jgi:lysophospholipase L1-like esterase
MPDMAGNDAKKYDPLMRAHEAKEMALEWHSPKAPPFRLVGLAWFATDGLYRRMPLRPKRALPAAVDALANHTAGAQIGFQSDSARVFVRVKLAAPADMDHMPATGQCGFDCYVGPPGDARYVMTTRYDRKQTAYECPLFDATKFDHRQPADTFPPLDTAGPALRNFTLNFPLYQGMEEVSVGLDAGAQVLPPPSFALDRPVVAYGTSITQGGCAARPGMAWTNILSRRLNVEFINLGFSGSGCGEPEVAATIAEIPNPACFIVDYEANSGGTEPLKKTFPVFVGILRKAHPKVPILVISAIPYSFERLNPRLAQPRLERREFLRGAVGELRRGGDRLLFFQDGGELLGEDFEECSVDGAHPTDLGFRRIADGLTPVVRGILGL